MEIGESFFGKNHGKLAHLRNLAPKIIYGSIVSRTKSEQFHAQKLSIYIGYVVHKKHCPDSFYT
jgi:hypothetical protein